MNYKAMLSNLAALTAVGGIVLAPATAFADDDHGKKKGHDKGHWNSAPPKKNGRHDNRDWNKGNDDWRRDDSNRRNDDNWRRDQERRQYEEMMRRKEQERDAQRRRDEQRRQDSYRNRNDDWRYNDNRYNNGGWQDDRRQDTKNEWRNLAIAGGVVAVLGLLNNDSTLTFAGGAGALYSLYRYEQDRKSQNQHNRARAYYFSQPSFYRDGNRYDRRTVTQNGQKYYQFCRS